MNIIKHLTFALLLTVFCTSILSPTYAQENNDLDGFLNGLFSSLGESDASFGFSDSDSITTKKQGNDIMITFPTITKEGTKIKKYALRGSNVSMDDFSNTDVDYDSSSVIDEALLFTDEDLKGNTLSTTLSGLTDSITYYVTVTPIATDGTNGRSSKEFHFSLGNPTASTDNNTDTNESTNANDSINNTTDNTIDNHSAGNTQEAISNVSYTHDGLSITMKRSNLQQADQLRVSYATISNSTNKTVVGTAVNPNKETFTFAVPSADTYIVSLLPLKNGSPVGTEVHQTIHITEAPTTPTTPTSTPANPNNPIPTTPPGGPEDILLFIILASGVVYIGYKRFVRM